MAEHRMRPRFAIDVACDVERVVQALGERIGEAEPPLEGHFDAQHCVLRIPDPRRSFWSPELDLSFEPLVGEGDGRGVRVRCLFGPRPSVWTGFAFVYAALAAAGVAGGLYGVAQLTLGEPPWALAVPVAAVVSIGAVYAASFVGQGLAATQMYELRRYLEECLDRAEARARALPRTPLDSARL